MKIQFRLSHKLLDWLVGLLVVALIAVVVWGIWYGAYNLSKTNHKNKIVVHSPVKHSHQVVTHPTTNSATSTTQSSTALTNSGPGSSEIIVFASATVIGTSAYFILKKRSLAR
jgi:hypothetical protein